eukprot:COSAG02_NODE_478_length_21511_cov_120.811087_13_plen_145_part_00
MSRKKRDGDRTKHSDGKVEDEIHQKPHQKPSDAFIAAAGENKEERIPPSRAFRKTGALVHHVPELVAHSGESIFRPQADLAAGNTLHLIFFPFQGCKLVLFLQLSRVEVLVLRGRWYTPPKEEVNIPEPVVVRQHNDAVCAAND